MFNFSHFCQIYRCGVVLIEKSKKILYLDAEIQLRLILMVDLVLSEYNSRSTTAESHLNITTTVAILIVLVRVRLLPITVISLN